LEKKKLTLNITKRVQDKRRKRPGISGILAAVILFAMLFVSGMGYLLFVNQSDLSVSQANAGRQNAQLLAGKEILFPKVVLSGASTLVVSANNTGGTTVTISYIYVENNTGRLVNPPGFMGPSGGTNATAVWPISLSIGQSTQSLKGCVAGKTGCNIALTGYTFVGSPVTVEIVTSSGNTFGIQYPPPATQSAQGDALVVKMVVTPPQTLSCTAPSCITNTVTVYNYAPAPVSSVVLTPATPTASVTGTATVFGGSCSAAVPSTTIPGYAGVGNPSSITFTCTYSAQTGSVGGLASFWGSATGVLNGGPASSAEAVSNSVQIGGSSNVPTQGAFAANYFFLKFSACTNGPSGPLGSYTYASACTTNPVSMPPASVSALANGNYISGIGDYYVAYYAQVTNNFNATLPIIDNSYLFMDPGISTEAYSFLVGTATNPQVPYYPNYCSGVGCLANKLPILTGYAATAATCAESAPLYNPPPPTTCIDVAPGQTVTLTFASCGFGSSNWVWGGTAYATKLDNSAGCITTPPGFKDPVTGKALIPQGQTLSIVLSYLYKNQVYTQIMPFEGQTITNQRTTSTSLSCSPSPDPVNAPSTCTVTITDLSSGTSVTPTGTVTLSQAPASGGTFSGGGTCVLSGGGAVATCTLTYAPSLGKEGTDTLTASYPGDLNHAPSSGQTTLSATQRTTSTSVSCVPAGVATGGNTTCTATVTDTSAPTAVTPTGTVSFTANPVSSGNFITSSCTLAAGSCSVTYHVTAASGTITITGTYGGDTDHSGSVGSTSISAGVVLRLTSTSVSCLPISVPVNSPTTCTVTVTDTSSGPKVTPTGIVTFTAPAGSGTFAPGSGQCTLAGGAGTATCTLTFSPGLGKEGSITITATYPGDVVHSGSSGSQTITAIKRSTSTAVSCLPASGGVNVARTCTATVTDISPGTTVTPTGTVTFTVNPIGQGTFGTATCTLSAGSCSVTYTPTSAGSVTVTGTYNGDTDHSTSSGTSTISAGSMDNTTTTIVCVPSTFDVDSHTVCTITVTDISGSPTTPTGTVTLTTTGSGEFKGPNPPHAVVTSCTLSGGGATATCTVWYDITSGNNETNTLTATYAGDSSHNGSSGNTSITTTGG
jgi:hypothetical protein